MTMSRRNTSESESEPGGNKLRGSRATQDSGLSGVSVEMNAWPRRGNSNNSHHSSSNALGYQQPPTPDTAAPTQPLPLPPPQAAYARQPGPPSPRHSPGHHFNPPLQQRASSSSSQDGRNSRRGSRGNGTPRPTLIPALGADGEELYFPLSPAPPKRKSDTGTRLTHGSDSDVLPPDDRNYLVPAFNPALFQLPPQQEPLPQLQPYLGRQQDGSSANLPSSTHLRIIHASTAGPPSIYWSDDGTSGIVSMGEGRGGGGGAETATIATSTNPSAFTFYREGTPPPGGRDNSDGDDEDDDDDTIQNEKFTRHQPQFREIGLAVSSPQRNSKQSKQNGNASGFRDLTGVLSGTAASGAVSSGGGGGGGGGGGRGHRAGGASNDDQAGGLGLEDQDLAEAQFVNGRYVPPALRDGRKPGRKPVSEDADARSVGSYYDRGRSGRRFWVIAGIVMFFVIAVAVGVGVGVGITLSNKNRRDYTWTPLVKNSTTTSSATTAAATPATVVAAASASATLSSSATGTSSAAASTATSLTDCPAANGTTYTVPGSSTSFLRLCGIDYSGTGAAVDLSHLPTTTMDDCMNNCAGTSGCTACGWGPPNSSTTSTDSTSFVVSGTNYQCYMKSTLGSAKTAVTADSDWCFAILQ